MQDPKQNDVSRKRRVSIENHVSHKEDSNVSLLDSRPSINPSKTTNKIIFEENFTDQEHEVQVIDLQTEEQQQPLLQLFPDLRQEGVNFQDLNKKFSTTEMTKMLVGKKANFGTFKYSQKLTKHWPPMPAIAEIESLSDTTMATSTKYVPRERAYSRDADAEEDDE